MLNEALSSLDIPRNGVQGNARLDYHSTAFEETRRVFEPCFTGFGPWLHAGVITVFPQHLLKLHTDHGIDGRIRWHVVLETNAHAWSYHAGVWAQHAVGEVFPFTATEPHGAVNFGPTPRTHLFFDVAG